MQRLGSNVLAVHLAAKEGKNMIKAKAWELRMTYDKKRAGRIFAVLAQVFQPQGTWAAL